MTTHDHLHRSTHSHELYDSAPMTQHEPQHDGPIGPFFMKGFGTSLTFPESELRLLAKTEADATERVMQLLTFTRILPVLAPEDEESVERHVAIHGQVRAAADEVESVLWIRRGKGYDPDVAREIRHATRGYERTVPLLRTTLDMVTLYPSEVNRKAEIIIRQLISQEAEQSA